MNDSEQRMGIEEKRNQNKRSDLGEEESYGRHRRRGGIYVAELFLRGLFPSFIYILFFSWIYSCFWLGRREEVALSIFGELRGDAS
jgi:hypothetical protein